MSSLIFEKERELKDRISKKFMVVLNYYFEDYFAHNPEEASTLGLNRHDRELKNYSDEAYEKEVQFNKDVRKKLKFINPYNLTLEEHLDYILLQSRTERFLYDHENLPQHRKHCPQLYLPIGAIYPLLLRTMKDTDRINAIVSRLSLVPRLINQAKANLDNPPKIWTQNTIDRLKSVKDFFKNLPNIDVVKKAAESTPDITDKLLNANNACLKALEEYDRFLNVELMERSNGEFCIGRQAFDFYLKNDHFLDYTSGYLNELGYELINKASGDISGMAAQIDKDKPEAELIKEIEEDYVPADKLIETYTQLTERTKNFVIDNDIVTLPKEEELNVIPTPEYFRSIIPFAAYYTLGPYEESNIGQFWVTPVTEQDEAKRTQMLKDGHNLHRLPSIVLHESYPGHHVQIMREKEVVFGDEISTMRRATHNSLLLEGWALYCEQMMGELGFYSDKQKLMMHKQKLWRSARVVLDIELHTGRKSFDEAVLFMVTKLGMSEEFARAEVTRYTMSPTYQLSYEIGRRLINQIRDKEKIKLGNDFSLKQFHDKLLSKGSLPIKLIEESIFNQKVEVLN